MAFTGAAAIVVTGQDVARLTGLTLAAGASGTITENGGAGDETLPVGYEFGSEAITNVEATQTAAGASMAPLVAKSGTPFDTITIKNGDAINPTGALEIVIRKGQCRTA